MDDIDIGYAIGVDIQYDSRWAMEWVFLKGLQKDVATHHGRVKGNVTEMGKLGEILSSMDFNLAFRSHINQDDTQLWVNRVNESAVWMMADEGYLNAQMYFRDPVALERAKEAFRKFVVPRPAKDNNIYVLVNGTRGLTLSKLGQLSAPLTRTNYSAGVLESYDYIRGQLANPKPDGRICIFSGVAGSGKTHLIKGLVSETENCRFIMVPPQYVVELSGPELLRLLIAKRDTADTEDTINDIESVNATVILVEDGDSVIAPRAVDNMSAISSLLNTSDGIIGEALNIKLVLTTNAKIEELDPAIERPGRLCKMVEVNALNREEATAALKDIDATAVLPEGKFFTLAEIYKLKRTGSPGKKKEKKGMGFGT